MLFHHISFHSYCYYYSDVYSIWIMFLLLFDIHLYFMFTSMFILFYFYLLFFSF